MKSLNRPCNCGGSPLLIQEMIKPYGIQTGNFYYYCRCPNCGHKTSGGGAGLDAMGSMITDERAREIALMKWENDITREIEKKRYQA